MPTALVTEDEPTILMLLQGLVEELGYSVLTARNGVEALALIEDDLSIELLLSDINLGSEPDGLILAQTARDLRPGLQVLYASGEVLTDGMKARMVERSAFLPKPFTPEELRTAVTSIASASP